MWPERVPKSRYRLYDRRSDVRRQQLRCCTLNRQWWVADRSLRYGHDLRGRYIVDDDRSIHLRRIADDRSDLRLGVFVVGRIERIGGRARASRLWALR